MELTDRDINIISFIEKCGGATIDQIEKSFFKSYDTASRRLRKLQKNNFVKVKIHPIVGKKVYYIKKLPSFHGLVITSVAILLKDKIKYIEREYKIKNKLVDCIFILNSGKIIVLEVDIFNRTSKNKIKIINDELHALNMDFEIWIACKNKRNRDSRIEGIKYLETRNLQL